MTAALSVSEKLHSCQKSHFAVILEAELSSLPDTDIIVMGGSALVNALPPTKSKTFEDYTEGQKLNGFQYMTYNRSSKDSGSAPLPCIQQLRCGISLPDMHGTCL